MKLEKLLIEASCYLSTIKREVEKLKVDFTRAYELTLDYLNYLTLNAIDALKLNIIIFVKDSNQKISLLYAIDEYREIVKSILILGEIER